MNESPLSRTINFVLPEDKDLPSGGNIYNAQLIAALRSLGQEVQEIGFVDYQKAVSSAEQGIFGVDSLFVDALQSLPPLANTAHFTFFIMHHLESLHPPAGQDAMELFQKEQKVLQAFDLILTSSDFSRKYLRSNGLSVPTIVVEPALSASASTATAKPAPSLPLRAIMVANVVERKGILEFLQALIQSGKRIDDFYLNIFGRKDMEPRYYQECQHLVENSWLKGKVNFAGALSHAETLAQYPRHHLLLSAARMETFGMAIQEATAVGLPLLVLEGGHSGQHVQGQNGKLCANILELAGNFLQFSRDEAKLLAFLTTAFRAASVQRHYRWEQAAGLFLHKIRHFL